MKLIFALWLLFGFAFWGNSQVVIIKDSETNLPVESVSIMSEYPSLSVLTDSAGRADLSAFKGVRSISFSHVQYKPAVYSYQQLESLKFTVWLTKKIVSLGRVNISPQRWEQHKIETPNRITLISMKEASFQNPQTSADLLGMSGYAFIQKSQLGGGSPMLRGMATNRVLLVVDGVRMNTAIFRSGNVQNVISIDVNALESTEILFGPGSVMYGSDAIGGVMNFITMKPRLSASKTPAITGNAMMRFSSANLENTGHADFNLGYEKWAFLTSFTYADYSDLRSGKVGGVPYFLRPYYVIIYDNKDNMVPNNNPELQVGSAYSQVNFMQKVRYRPSKNIDMEYGFHFSETSTFNRYDRLYVMRTDGPYKNKLRWAEWYYGPQKWHMHRFGITYSKANRFFDNVRLVAAKQFFEESRYDREFMFRELRMQKENVDAYSINLDFEKKVNGRLNVFYGHEFVFNKVHSIANLTHVVTQEKSPTVTRYPDGSVWLSDGTYLTASYKLRPKWMFTAGMRFNQFLIKAEFDTLFFAFPFSKTRMSNGSLNGSAGFVYSPQESWQVYLNAASGFRAPNVDDMGKVFESVPGYLVVPNPNLKPEKVLNMELGTMKTFKDFLKVDATIYHTWLSDAMVRKNAEFNGDTTIRYLGNKSRIQSVQNVTSIRVYGIQAGVEFYYKGFGFRSNISYQNGKEQTPDSLVYYPLRHAAPTFGSTHLTYEYKNLFKVDFYIVYNAKMDFEDLALTERTNASYARDDKGRAYVAGWHTLNFKMAYFPHPFISITAGMENITDIMYRPYSSGINAPGRNFITSLKVKF